MTRRLLIGAATLASLGAVAAGAAIFGLSRIAAGPPDPIEEHDRL